MENHWPSTCAKLVRILPKELMLSLPIGLLAQVARLMYTKKIASNPATVLKLVRYLAIKVKQIEQSVLA